MENRNLHKNTEPRYPDILPKTHVECNGHPLDLPKKYYNFDFGETTK